MAQEDTFELNDFAKRLHATEPDLRDVTLGQELARVRNLTVRDAAKRFQQQLYITKLEKLSRAFRGLDVSKELTPSERQAHALFFPSATAAAAAPAPEAILELPPNVEPSGKERRVSRRIQMKTRVRVRRDAYNNHSEVVEPINVSRGGISFQSTHRLVLHEIVWVTMHYTPNTSEMETKSLIVRAAPLAGSTEYSYGVKFL